MNLKNLSYLLVGGCLLLASCKKDDPTPEPDPTPTPSAAQLTSFIQANNSNAVQTFTIDEDNPTVINGAQGSTLEFWANSFVDVNGNEVTGNIQIELTEVYGKKDMMFLNKQTLGDNGTTLFPLISGGEFKVEASQNGNEIFLKQGYSYNMDVQAPGGVDPNMDVFYQNSAGDDTLTWTQSDSSIIIGGTNVYDVYFDSLGWVNCDYFMSDPGPFTEVQVNVPAGYNNQNCMLFVSFDGYNSVTNIYGYQGGNFTTGSYYELPIGMDVHFVAMAFINNVPYSAIVSSTLTSNHLEVISALTATTEAQLAADIQALP